jgi:hypothetical protein
VTERHHDAKETCQCVTEHRPPVLEGEFHHVWPLYLGGPKNGELAYVCSTTHDSVHELLRLMLRSGRELTYAECQSLERPRVVSRFAYTLARRGYEAHIRSR